MDTTDLPEWYYSMSPTGQVPGLIYKTKFYCESIFLVDLLDKNFPKPELWHLSPDNKMKDKYFLNTFSKVSTIQYK